MNQIKTEIASAIDDLAQKLDAHPERRIDRAWEQVMNGQLRPYPVLALGPGLELNMEGEKPAPPLGPPEQRLLAAVKNMVAPLEMLNPFQPLRGLGTGEGTLAASFGLFLDPTIGYRPRGHKTMDEVIASGIPDLEKSGIISEVREDIDTTLALTPDWVKIGPPDMQGPFNLAHMILGQEALTAPYDEPEKFYQVMTIMTDFIIAFADCFSRWVGPTRLPQISCGTSRNRIAECSVNLVSPSIYLEHILPHDQRLATYYGQVAIHPCSGPHVFYATIRNLPNVIYTEAGLVEKTRAIAGSIGVDDALTEIGDRPITLAIGQELPKNGEEEFIRRDLDRAHAHPRLLFGYTGMHWTNRDKPRIKDLHRRLDQYWQEKVVGR
jgi:hypothetical protein